MNPDRLNAVLKVKQLMEGDTLSLVLDEIKEDLARSIVNTKPSEKDKRDELYSLSLSLELIKSKFQDYVNYSSEEVD